MRSLTALNNNCIVVMDSDRKVSGQSVNASKQRMVREVGKVGGVAWITDGREIENYIPPRILEMLGLLPPKRHPGDYGDVIASVAKERGKGKKYVDKVAIAEQVCSRITRRDLEENGKLAARLEEVAAKLLAWKQT